MNDLWERRDANAHDETEAICFAASGGNGDRGGGDFELAATGTGFGDENADITGYRDIDAAVGVGGDVRIWSLVEMRLLASYSPGDETLLGLWLSSDGSRLWIWGTGPNLYELDLTRADR